MIDARTIVSLVILAIAGGVPAEEIFLTPAEVDNLGVSFEKLSPASGVAGIEATARVVLPPASDAIIGALQTGLLTRLAANVGDEVVEGQILAELQSPDFISLQREFLDALNAQRLAQSEYARDAQLQAEGIISSRRLQETTTRKAVADTALDEHRQLLRFAGMRDEDVRTLENRRHLAGSLLIRAPFNGVVVERMASTGERLDSMSPIYRVADMSELWLEINVSQEQLVLVRAGAHVAATGSDGVRSAKVSSIGRSVDPATQSVVVRAQLETSATGLMPGQFVAVRVFVDDAAAATTALHAVSSAAVTRSGTASYVFVRTAAGVEITKVDVISVSGDRAYIRGDLEADDAIAASGVSALKSLWSARATETT